MKVPYLLLSMLIIAAVVGAIVLFILPVFFGVEVTQILPGEKKSPVVVPPLPLGPGPLALTKRPLSGGQPGYSPSEIGCTIAQDITFDYSAHGTKGARNCVGDLCPVGFGVFNPWKWQWKQEDEDTLERFQCAGCASNLDEVCVTRNLKKQTVGDQNFCSDTIYVEETGEFLRFGNKKCTGLNPGASVAECRDWDNCCASLCPSADNIISWHADAESDKYLVGSDSPLSRGNQLVQDNRTYGWAIFWNKAKRGYEVQFPRVPENMIKGRVDMNNLALELANTFKYSERTNPAGAWQPEFRRILDWNFTPAQETSLVGFLKKFQDGLPAAGVQLVGTLPDITAEPIQLVETLKNLNLTVEPLEYDIYYEGCGGPGECLAASSKGTIAKVEIKNKNGVIVHTHYWPNLFGHRNYEVDYNRFKVRTNIPDEEGFKADHRYRIILNHYRGATERLKIDPKNAGCQECGWGTHGFWCEDRGGSDQGYLGCGCGVWTGHACGWSTSRMGMDWDTNDYDEIYELSYLDFSLIIIDMGVS